MSGLKPGNITSAGYTQDLLRQVLKLWLLVKELEPEGLVEGRPGHRIPHADALLLP